MGNDARSLFSLPEMTKTPLLVLAHRLPFPPNRGDKIRSFQMLKHLSRSFDIYLGTFFDDSNDQQYIGELKPYVKEVFALQLDMKWYHKIEYTLRSLATRKPITLVCFDNKEMKRWVERMIQQYNIKAAVAICSSMAPYIQKQLLERKVLDFVDLDSDKWRQCAQRFSWPMSWIYRRESHLLFKYEQTLAENFDHNYFVSDNEVALFNRLTAQRYKNKCSAVGNGIDTDYFDPSVQFSDKIDLTEQLYITFTGTMNAIANVESMSWFIQFVWPVLLQRIPQLKLYIVGNSPTAKVKGWSAIPGVEITGYVDDVRPYLQHAAVAIAPMQLARGVQNKVLEAMAMAKAVVLTPLAAEGITLTPGQQKYVVNNARQMIDAILVLLSDASECVTIGRDNRQWILEYYQWTNKLQSIKAMISGADDGKG